ncbi:MAG: hypothetical protein SF162_20580 [bacterium]|nr:hypothetical protein [bacterium]
MPTFTDSPILVIRDFGGNNADLFQISLEGVQDSRITNVLDTLQYRYVEDADCAPVRDEIAYIARSLRLISTTGQNDRAIFLPGILTAVTWSPTETQIAFTGYLEDASSEIYTVLPDGSGLARLTTNTYVEMWIDWSPSGSQIVASYQDGASGGLLIVNSDGSGTRLLTAGAALDIHPEWSPDGSEIVFASNRNGSFHLYTIQPDGSNLTQLTFGETDHLAPVWSPDGQWILFRADRENLPSQLQVVPRSGGSVQTVPGQDTDMTHENPACWLAGQNTPTPTPPPTATPNPDIVFTQGSYRAVQRVGNPRVFIERAMATGLDPFDSDPVDGWTLVGRTNGAGDNGTLRAFTVIDAVPYAAIQHTSKGCIVVTPASLAPRLRGQTRLVTIIEQGNGSRCQGDWALFPPG